MIANMLENSKVEWAEFTCTWAVEQFISAAIILITAFLIIWQISRQYRNSLELQRKNKVQELHLEIYKDIADKIEKANDDLSSIATSIAFSIPSGFTSKRFLMDESRKLGREMYTSPLRETDEILLSNHALAVERVSSIILVMEKFEIALPDFLTIRRSIMISEAQLNKAFDEYHEKVLPYLPVTLPEEKQKEFGKKILDKEPPTEEQNQELKKVGLKYYDVYVELASAIYDLRLEAQNYLLSPLFNRRISRHDDEDYKKELFEIYNVEASGDSDPKTTKDPS